MDENKWYEKWFSNKAYLSLYSHRDEKDARDLINLIQRNIPLVIDSKILDVCCGFGRHSIELARRGYSVTGFDLSSFLISKARESLRNTKEKNLKVEFLIKDMIDFSFSKSFDAAINIFTSFGYFESDEDNFKVFINIKKSLKKGGYFVFDFINSEYLKKSLIPESEDFVDGNLILQKRYLKDNYVFKDIFIGDEKFTERLKLYSDIQIYNALKDYGFNILNVFGDYYGNSFEKPESSRIIVISQTIN